MNNHDLIFILRPILDKAKQLIKSKEITMPIVSIAGGPGAGKSYFAQQLQALLQHDGFNTVIIAQDNFSHHDGNAADVMPHINPHLKWKLVHEALQQVCTKKTAVILPFRIRNPFAYAPQTVLPYTIEYRTIDMTHVDLVIFEGAHALSGKDTYDFFAYSSLGIFIEVSDDHMRLWRLEREKAKPPMLQRPQDIFDQHLAKGMEIYRTYVAPTKKNAAFVVHKQDKDCYSLSEYCGDH